MKTLLKNKYFSYLYVAALGGITSFSLPPYNYFIINFFTLSLFYIFITNYKKHLKKKIDYFKYGWIFGFGYFVLSLYWIIISLTFDQNFKILIPIALILVPSFIAIFYGLPLYFFSYFKNYNNVSLVLIFSVLFSFSEFIRGNVLTGFPWNFFVFSFSENLAFIQILSLIGTYSFNLICLTFFLLPAVFILRKSKYDIFFCTIFICLIFGVILFGEKRLNSKNDELAKDKKYLIKVISSKVDIKRFYNTDSEYDIVNDLINLSKPDKSVPTIFIWPEGMLTFTNLNDIYYYKDLFQLNFSNKHLIILGINDVQKNNNQKIFNSLAIVDNNLKVLNYYHKNNLVPFGEFLPMENFLKKIGLKTITNNYQSFSKGKDRKIISIKNENFDLNFLPLICYEIIYSGRIKKKNNFDLIINISEDGWFGNSIGPHQHFAHSIFRAVEEGRNIIRSTNNGISAFIGPKGKIISKAESTESGVLEIRNLKSNKETFFSKKGNNIFFYFLLFYIILIFFLKINREIK